MTISPLTFDEANPNDLCIPVDSAVDATTTRIDNEQARRELYCLGNQVLCAHEQHHAHE